MLDRRDSRRFWRLGRQVPLMLTAVLFVASCGSGGGSKVAVTTPGGADNTSATDASGAASTVPEPGTTPRGSTLGTGSSDTTKTTSGSSGTAKPSPQGTTTTTSSARPPGVDITEADDGRTFTFSKGTAIRVLLRSSSGFHWSSPASGNQAVVSGSGSAAPSGDGSGTFQAAGSGQTQITSTGTPACAFSTPRCYAPNRMFSVTVIVRA